MARISNNKPVKVIKGNMNGSKPGDLGIVVSSKMLGGSRIYTVKMSNGEEDYFWQGEIRPLK